MRAFAEIDRGGKRPGAVAGNDSGANRDPAIINGDRRSGFRGAGKLWSLIVGATTVTDRAGDRIGIV